MEPAGLLDILESNGIGAAILNKENKALMTNGLFCGFIETTPDEASQKPLQEIAPNLFDNRKIRTGKIKYAFQKYYRVGLHENFSENNHLLTIAECTQNFMHDLYVQVLNKLNESVIVCDDDSNIIMINDAGTRQELLLSENIRGSKVYDIYIDDNQNLKMPQVLATGESQVDVRQQYTTKYGKRIDNMTNNYPLYDDGKIAGAVSIMEDFQRSSELSKKIIDLQAKLLDKNTKSTGNKPHLSAKYTFDEIISNNAMMLQVIQKCKQAAKSSSSILIYGETGTGKELFAQSIHNSSRRMDRPFIAINCAALPENLLESLLFGTTKGAFTGAENREGLFEQAHTGTLLLDEINSMSLALQSKLLRVLQDGVICRLGSSVNTTVDVRVISNINIPPAEAVEKNILRQDLFYRLGVVNLRIPPLRERKDDIALLAKTFVLNFNTKLFRNISNISSDALAMFMAYHWPGNVRELQHAIEHAINILPDNQTVITSQYLPEHINEAVAGKDTENSVEIEPEITSTWNEMMDQIEKQMLIKSLQENGGNVSRTARLLGMSRQSLQYRMNKHSLNN